MIEYSVSFKVRSELPAETVLDTIKSVLDMGLTEVSRIYESDYSPEEMELADNVEQISFFEFPTIQGNHSSR